MNPALRRVLVPSYRYRPTTHLSPPGGSGLRLSVAFPAAARRRSGGRLICPRAPSPRKPGVRGTPEGLSPRKWGQARSAEQTPPDRQRARQSLKPVSHPLSRVLALASEKAAPAVTKPGKEENRQAGSSWRARFQSFAVARTSEPCLTRFDRGLPFVLFAGRADTYSPHPSIVAPTPAGSASR